VLFVNLNDGGTERFDIASVAGAALWDARSASPQFQSRIRGASLQVEGRVHSIPLPHHFRRLRYSAGVDVAVNGVGKLVAEWLEVQADEVGFRLTVYTDANPPMSKLEVNRTGMLRWKPARHPATLRKGA
jgi:hypothetical protein